MFFDENVLIEIYDTTLRDGTQAEDISLSVQDKIIIAHALDDLGVHYIEGGWPGSNPKDIEFFKAMKKEKLNMSHLVAFGSTRRKGKKAKDDETIKALLKSNAQIVTIFGKSWLLHVEDALKVTREENLDMIHDTVGYLKTKVEKVFYDAEHFFDGYKDNPQYALQTLWAAEEAGADYVVLCDTNGGSLPYEIGQIVDDVRRNVDCKIGIHCHNDSETAVANSIYAVKMGATMVQGTINGYGERCGNANLCSILPALAFKMGLNTINKQKIKNIRKVSRLVNELANMRHNKHQPYVGQSAFAHKGGIHVSAVLKNATTYEHITPEFVGNKQRVLVSDLSGKSNILYKAKEYGLDIDSKSKVVTEVLEKLKTLEHEGYQYEGAEASFELLIEKALNNKEDYFKLISFNVTDSEDEKGRLPSVAEINLKVGKIEENTKAKGNGPVNAMDKALRKALESFYPSIKEVKLIDFKVRVLSGKVGTGSVVRVLVESSDSHDRWGTVGVSENVIEAAWLALVDSLEYKLYKDSKNGELKKAQKIYKKTRDVKKTAKKQTAKTKSKK